MDRPVRHRRDRPALRRSRPRHVRPPQRAARTTPSSWSATAPAQRARNDRITVWAKAELDRLAAAGAFDRTLQPAPRVGRPALRRPHPRPVGPPARLLRRRSASAPTTARSPSAARARCAPGCRCGASRRRSATGAPHLARITVPSLVVQSLADRGVFPSDAHAIHDALAAEDKALELLSGEHYFETEDGTRWPTSSRRGSRPGRRVVIMAATLRATVATTLPPDDDHPYRTGAWRPQCREWDADDLEVEGELPADLAGVYLRNTENPVHDVDRPLPPVRRRRHVAHDRASATGTASYRNRFVRTDGLAAEQAAGRALWAGIARSGPSSRSASDGWGARGRMKDASSTDVVVHNGRALTSFYQCGDLYALDPATLEQLGTRDLGRPLPDRRASPRTPRSTSTPASCSFFNYGKQRAVHALRRRRRRPTSSCTTIDVPLPGPAPAARHGVHRALRDPQRLPAVLGPDAPRARACTLPAFFPDLPTPLRGRAAARARPETIRWFEADAHLRAALDQRLRGRRRGRARRLLPGRPRRPARRRRRRSHEPLFRFLDSTRCRRGRIAGGSTSPPGRRKEEPLSDRIMEFGMINGAIAGRPLPLHVQRDRRARAGSCSTGS